MIQSFAKYKKHIAYPLFVLLYLQTIISPLHAAMVDSGRYDSGYISAGKKLPYVMSAGKSSGNMDPVTKLKQGKAPFLRNTVGSSVAQLKTFIGGPSSPEASTFKAVGSDNLVNLFTGDFSYSIPLLDVGGYPVNLFYSGGITMEQEASWVGLGWNINPGSVNRNMRGVPDDFNGNDTLIQHQNVKPNRTWGGEVGVDGELFGNKEPNVNFSLGYSYNNYLGPAMDLGAGISVTIPLLESLKADKSVTSSENSGLSGTAGLNAKLSSRSGLTFSPSLNLSLPIKNNKANIGVGISTSYNSRTGIKDLNISSQTSSSRFQNDNKNNEVKMSGSIGSSSISFARPTYIPTLRMPMEYTNYSGQLELGLGMYGIRGAAHAQGYYSESKVPEESRVVYKPLVGFMYSEKAKGNKDAVMDFNRLNDAEVTPNTPILSAPQYAYDIFSIQGEGTGGVIRAYRGDLGFMRDNETVSKDKNISIGFDIAPPGHFGGNWNIVKSPTRVGGWEDANNTLRQTMNFTEKATGKSLENVYFRNPGEASVTNSELIDRIGGDNLVRFELSGSNVNPRLESRLEKFNKNSLRDNGILPISGNSQLQNRDKRTQVTTMLTAAEASEVGLEKTIRNYTGTFSDSNNIEFTPIDRKSEFRKPHHISEIDVLEQNGMRYVYGVPVYSIRQKDYTFSVDNIGDPVTGIVEYSDDEPRVDSRHMDNNSKLDGYVMSQETPAYASSFLLTGLLSPDYVDVKGDGITEDDLGSAVKFDYAQSGEIHKWRTPRGPAGTIAHFNEGLKSEKEDNKATISYGEREVWYLNSIESKSMVAIFKTESRDDAKGVKSDLDGSINANENANKRLKQIDLYTKAEIKAKGILNARPVKTVHFSYSYSLCHGTPDNKNGEGKLTLDSVYFTYNGQPRAKRDKYVFSYGNKSANSDNPSYANNASDKWGTYKNPDTNPTTNSAANPGTLTNADYPYTSKNKAKNDEFAAAWSLKKILLPSGGQMEVEYEADDYAYVQDRRACDMFNIYGLGNSKNSTPDSSLYQNGFQGHDNYYVYIKLPQGLQGNDPASQQKEIFEKYLQSLNQLAFKLLINMPKGPEALTVYANYDAYGLCPNSVNKDIIYIKLRDVDGQSPLSKSAIGFITENLPDQAFKGYKAEINSVGDFLKIVPQMLGQITQAFKNVNTQMRDASNARTIAINKSFVRLANPFKTKYGGGIRVKRVLVRDNWQRMTNQFTSTYGQDYDYTTTEKINGVETVVSSGVASYEPGLGSEENPFREIVGFSNKMPLASAQYGAIEMPMLDGLYPSPGVGYSKVTIRSIHRNGTHGDATVRSAIGKQVTEFYTARDYPTFSSYTPISSMEYHFNSFFNILYKELTDRKVLSQGFLVETNDMHGKMKSQKAYSEKDEKTPISYSLYTYKNTGKNGFNDKVDFVNNNTGGSVTSGNMGVDMELMTDVREFKVQTDGFNGQIQTDFITFLPFPIFLVPMLPIKTITENRYRAVTCTKLINYHAIEDSVIVMDKGSVISTKTVAYDAETGTPIVSRTANEFNDPIYNINYPAYWAYSGMSPAYKNIGMNFSGVNFSSGKITSGVGNMNVFESGDELYLTSSGSGASTCVPESEPVKKLWAIDNDKPDGGFIPFLTQQIKYFGVILISANTIEIPLTSITDVSVFIVNNYIKISTSNVPLKIISVTSSSTSIVVQTDINFPTTLFPGPLFSSMRVLDYSNLSVPPHNFVFMDSLGRPYNKSNVSFKILRSGKRNNLGLSAGSVTCMKNPVQNNMLVVNNDINVVSASAAEYKEKWQIDKDEILRKDYYTVGCPQVEMDSISCGGTLERNLNPYIKGLLGNFKPNRSYTFYGSRNESDVNVATAIRKNGYLKDFTNYWNYNSAGDLVPGVTKQKWVWNSELTKVNSKGQEVETRDALNRYTSAQYGFNKNMPVAMLQNARYGEGFSESFEDSGYVESINKTKRDSCDNKYVDFKGTGQIINAEEAGFNAHTGKYVLRIPSNSTAEKSLNIDPISYSNFSLRVPSDTVKDLTIRGGKSEVLSTVYPTSFPEPVISIGDMTADCSWNASAPDNENSSPLSTEFNYRYRTIQYTRAPTAGNCSITLYAHQSFSSFVPVGTNNIASNTGTVTLTIRKSDGSTLFAMSASTINGDILQTFNVPMSCDIYTIECDMDARLSLHVPERILDNFHAKAGYGLGLDNFSLISYSSVYPSTVCSFLKPLAATDSMLNPVFKLVPGKKMLLSAWVKESCGVPCNKIDFDKSDIQIWSGSTNLGLKTIKRTGAIIEGWQKIEGEFTVPENETTATLKFINTNNDGPIYLDDIRIHPFNSNMKSYTYDPGTLRLAAELDENNYASFYEYDEEGQLVRVKKETSQGIKTINETRASKQKAISDIQ